MHALELVVVLAVLAGPGPGAPSPRAPGHGAAMEEILGDNPTTWDPDHGPLTVWAQAGSRSAKDCLNRAEHAREELASMLDRMSARTDTWNERVQRCPNEPDVLRVAAFSLIQRDIPLPASSDEEPLDLSVVDQALADTRELALSWLADAEAEYRRRGERAGSGILYFRARALLSLGRVADADQAAARALDEGDVEPWRTHRVRALAAMLAGDLPRALDQARRALVFCPDNERALSGHVYALVLDRAGDTAAAQRVFATFRERGPTEARRVLETTLPTHERLFFLALEAQLSGRGRAEPLRLWQAYLARKEPGAAERALAERHLRALGPGTDAV